MSIYWILSLVMKLEVRKKEEGRRKEVQVLIIKYLSAGILPAWVYLTKVECCIFSFFSFLSCHNYNVRNIPLYPTS
ncbi:MAG: hypothetical protein F6K39_13075 [Okeania sp. SIO3B3]|nr:hypothetical protein [Okeania sp. SIO3B3]